MNSKCWARLSTSLVVVVWLGAVACSSYNVRPDMTAEERFEVAKRMFKNKDYRQAKMQFKLLTLNSPSAPFIDEVQFLLAESHFRLKEYILAADEYKRLLRLYPRSQWVDDAQFMVGMCNYKMSPNPALDQKYTLDAVASFQRFLEDFPNSEYVPEAERLLQVCRAKLAEKEFKAGELYRRFGDYYAALVYFKSVWETYYDTKFGEPALYWKSESLYRLGRFSEALDSFRELIIKFPKTRFRNDARQRIKKIEEELKKERAQAQATDGKNKQPEKRFQ